MTFNNSILAGTTLVREAITSEGFVAGSTGWAVDRDGDAEFNNITARGQIESVGVDTTSRLSAGSLVIEENADPTTLSRLTQNSLEFQDGNTNEKANLEFEDGIPLIGFTAPITTTRGVYFHGNLGFLVSGEDSFGVTVEEWNAVSFQNGWTNWGAPYAECEYILDANGWVNIQGVAAPGTTANGTVVFTLPAGYRPSASHQFHPYGATAFIFEVQADGDCVIVNHPGGGAALSISGIRFPVAT